MAMSEYHSNFASALESGGDPLSAAGSDGGPFGHIDWFERLHRDCMSEVEPLIVTAYDPATDSHCWLFLTRTAPKRAASLANWYSFTWLPVFAGNPTPDVRRALLETLAKSLKSHAAMLQLTPLPAADGDTALLAGALRTAGWQVDLRESSHNHWLETGGRSFAEWWAQRPGALRSTVQRKGKKNIVTIRIVDRFDHADWDAYEHVYRASWKPAEASPDFLRDWARVAGAEGKLRLGIAEIDAEPVAAQFWTCEGGTAYIHKLAHVAGHDAASPGTLLTHALFAHAFDVDKVQRIDFGTGDDGYKRDWMEQSAPLLTLSAWDVQQPASWRDFARYQLSRLAGLMRGR